VIEVARQNTNMARKADPRLVLNCPSFYCGVVIPHFCFGVTSHPWMKHVFSLSFCCFEIKRCFFQRVFWQKYFVDQTPTYKIKASQSWRLKVFWLRKWLDAWKWHEVTKQFWTYTSWNWTTHHITSFSSMHNDM